MFRGDPGEDFQCRCSMVAWDPEIDGKYEVKETPEAETPEDPPESAGNGDLRAELEKTKAEAAEREKGLQAALKKAERKAEILRKANERHAARTSADIDAIKTKTWKREMPKDMTDEAKEAMAKNWLEIERKLGIKKGRRMTVEEADEQKANPNYSKAKEFRINCQTCAPAYMLRLWGFDVKAKGKTPGSLSEFLSEAQNVFNVWKNADGTQPSFVSYRDFLDSKMYKKMTPGRYVEFFEETCKDVGVYECTILWSGRRGAHATILQRLEDGRLVNIEPQCYNGSSYRDIKRGLADEGASNRVGYFGVMRVDNKIFDKSFLSILAVSSRKRNTRNLKRKKKPPCGGRHGRF